jgi:hypothetical protein
MNKLLLSAALCAIGSACLATGAQAQQTVTFLCLAPTGHVCQYAVQTADKRSRSGFLRASERKCRGSRHTRTNIASATPARSRPTARRRGSIIGSWASGSTSTLASIPRMTLAPTRSQARRGRRNGGEPSRNCPRSSATRRSMSRFENSATRQSGAGYATATQFETQSL